MALRLSSKPEWTMLPPMSFDNLPQHVSSLGQCLPGETEDKPAHSYAGIGGGGGSDVISASLLGRMLRGP